MNNKMATNTYLSTYLSTTVSKKLSKQQRENHGYGKHLDGCQIGGVNVDMGEEVRGLRSTNR